MITSSPEKWTKWCCLMNCQNKERFLISCDSHLHIHYSCLLQFAVFFSSGLWHTCGDRRCLNHFSSSSSFRITELAYVKSKKCYNSRKQAGYLTCEATAPNGHAGYCNALHQHHILVQSHLAMSKSISVMQSLLIKYNKQQGQNCRDGVLIWCHTREIRQILNNVDTKTRKKKTYNNYIIGKGCTYQLHIYTFNLLQIISLTISEPALFEHFTKALTQFEVTLVLGTLNKLPELIGASLLLLRDLLLVHGLGLVWLLKDERVEWWNY